MCNIGHGRRPFFAFDLETFLNRPEGISTIAAAIREVFEGSIPESTIRAMKLDSNTTDTNGYSVATIVSGDAVIQVRFQHNATNGTVTVTAKVV